MHEIYTAKLPQLEICLLLNFSNFTVMTFVSWLWCIRELLFWGDFHDYKLFNCSIITNYHYSLMHYCAFPSTFYIRICLHFKISWILLSQNLGNNADNSWTFLKCSCWTSTTCKVPPAWGPVFWSSWTPKSWTPDAWKWELEENLEIIWLASLTLQTCHWRRGGTDPRPLCHHRGQAAQ